MKLKKIRESLHNDDNEALEYLYLEHGEYCVSKLIKKRNCASPEAEDLFIESVMIFREKILAGDIERLVNTRAYLYAVCENQFLARLKVQKRNHQKVSDIEMAFYSLSDTDEDSWNAALMKVTKEAWSQLSEKCKDIISYFYVDSLRMTEIAKIMNFASADVAKTAKRRCYKKFSDVAKELLESSKVEA